MQEIPFNIPYLSNAEEFHLSKVMSNRYFSGDGPYSQKCTELLQKITKTHKVLLTPSCTAALEMAALLLNIQAGDEVIMPSFAHPSTANAFVLRGARIVFVDVRPDTMNLSEQHLEQAVTPKSKCIVLVHYGGVACEMDTILEIAKRHQIPVVEDAAHGIGAYYQDRHLGTLGQLGAISFHETKNVHCGEGGALLINDPAFLARAEIIREKGTDRSAFQRKEVAFYTWRDLGSSFLLSEINAAFLFAQLLHLDSVNDRRSQIWQRYFDGLKALQSQDFIQLNQVPDDCHSNAHIFFIRCKDSTTRDGLATFLKQKGVSAHFHYIPLHDAKAGKTWGIFRGIDAFTTKDSCSLLRLPLYFALSFGQADRIIEAIWAYFRK